MVVLVKYGSGWERGEEYVEQYFPRWNYLVNHCDGEEVIDEDK